MGDRGGSACVDWTSFENRSNLDNVRSSKERGYNEDRRWKMATNVLTIPYSDDLLLSLKKSPEEFEAEARLLLAIKLYEMGRVSTGIGAQLADVSRVAFLFELSRFGLSAMGQEPGELAKDMANA